MVLPVGQRFGDATRLSLLADNQSTEGSAVRDRRFATLLDRQIENLEIDRDTYYCTVYVPTLSSREQGGTRRGFKPQFERNCVASCSESLGHELPSA